MRKFQESQESTGGNISSMGEKINKSPPSAGIKIKTRESGDMTTRKKKWKASSPYSLEVRSLRLYDEEKKAP